MFDWRCLVSSLLLVALLGPRPAPAGTSNSLLDISADGRTANERPIISFPPFVFGDPTVKQIKGFRYEQSYRPAGGMGCGGQQQRVSYKTGF